MRIENTSRMPTEDLRPVLAQVLRTAPLGKARTYLQGKDGLYVTVHNGKYSRVRGRIYPDACQIHREGKPIAVRGYIKLFIFDHTDLKELATTFAHELSHFKDWYNWQFNYIDVPWGREKRAEAFADRAVSKLAH